MKELSLQLETSTRPIYLNIANGLRQAIKSKQLEVGELLPSARKLAEQLKTNRHTVMAAYQELIAQGWVESIERKGYQVSVLLPIESSRLLLQQEKKQNKHVFQWNINPKIAANQVDSSTKVSHDYQYNFAGGMPDISVFPFKDFKSYLVDSLARPDIKGLNYGNNAGNENFIEQVKIYLRRVRSIVDKEIISVNGSQEALYLIAQLFLNDGDQVAVEALGYRPAWSAFSTTGAQLVPIKHNDKGIDIEHLTSLLSKQKIKLLYLTPLHQYPTTITIPINQRLAIYQLAAKHNVIIVEDDYDHEFHYKSQPLAPMAADDPLGLVIYLSTFSKIMFPGVRIGFMAVSKVIAPAIINYRTIINHKPNVLMQDAIGRWMQDGAFERHLRKMTKLYQQRRDHLIEFLQSYRQHGLTLNYHLPDGGMALWLDIGGQASEIEAYGARHDIFLLSEKHFHLDKKNNSNRYIRIGFAGLDSKKLTQGLTLLFSFFDKPHI
jgi:GntR family transcriptional regulator/MocR family aminotransferase